MGDFLFSLWPILWRYFPGANSRAETSKGSVSSLKGGRQGEGGGASVTNLSGCHMGEGTLPWGGEPGASLFLLSCDAPGYWLWRLRLYLVMRRDVMGESMAVGLGTP